MLISSCIPEPESPTIEVSENSQLMKVREWFEENKTTLRLPERGSNYRTDAQELILPFFEKEPDWDQFHHYYFPDGREVFEVSLENATKYFPKSMLDSFPNQNPADFVIQNIMFIKHETANRFDPLIARYYPDNQNNKSDFDEISYNTIPFDWSGKLEIFTYDEHFFVGFEFKEGVFERSYTYQEVNGDKKITQYNMDVRCTTIYFPVGYEACSGGHCTTTIERWVGETSCSGSSSGSNYIYNTGSGSDGGPSGTPDGGGCSTCPKVPPRDLPKYEPPTIPLPSSIIVGLKNPCAADIFRELSRGSKNLTDLTGLGGLDIFPGMLDLFEQSGKFDYRIQNGYVNGANAFTERVNGINVITLNNAYLAQATSLSIARTIIHETVHAYMWEQTKNTSDKNTLNLLNLYWEKYRDSDKSRWPDTHHAAMSNFILGMAVSLHNWDKNHGPTGGTLGFDYYYKSVFAGLVKKDNPTELIEEAEAFLPESTSWNEILIQINNEVSGNNKAKGEKCD
ncbi:MAG: hypothetical protein P8O16_01100 [Algoriphagus sp.]|uniref:hypothetical protein n=1 Tax=Algoriphagus sp. TaxID=1872435 RepID=UPI00262F47B7|nr:hypothetical protein [Algoriphagus sp.]MDG1275844.1 hypothetical protein [Algoriphagus sp.]